MIKQTDMTTTTDDTKGSDVLQKLDKLVLTETDNGNDKHDSEASPADSPTVLEEPLREWLDRALESTSNLPGPSPRVYCKLLVSNAAAGSIIGKAGSNINNFQAQTFSRMQLSKAEEYFPGTTERTLLITGSLKQVTAALSLVLHKLVREGVAPISPRFKASLQDKDQSSDNGNDKPVEESASSEGTRLMIKLLVPQPLCGIVIGKSGTHIKHVSETSDTTIRMMSPDGPNIPLTHKVFTISGTPNNILKAVALMMLKQSQDAKYNSFAELQSTYLPIPTAQPGGMRMVSHPGGSYYVPYSPHGMVSPGGGPSGMMYDPNLASASTASGGGDGSYYSLPVMLTEQQANLLGNRPGGSAIEQVEQVTGTRIRLHRESRRLNIAGPVEGVQMAHFMLNQRLAMMQMYANGYPTHSMSPPNQPHYYNGNSAGYYPTPATRSHSGYGQQHVYLASSPPYGSGGGIDRRYQRYDDHEQGSQNGH